MSDDVCHRVGGDIGNYGRPDRLLRWASTAVVVLALVPPLIPVLLATAGASTDSRPLLVAVVATALYLPIYVWLVRCAARDRRPAHGRWLLAASAVVILGSVPLGGPAWLPALAALALAALIVLRPSWSYPAVGILTVAQFPLAAALGYPIGGLQGAVTVGKALAIYALLHLLVAVRRLDDTRAFLASEAVLAERLRMHDELRRAVGTDLADIAACATRLATAPDAGSTDDQLRALVARSRATSGNARRTVSAYRRPSLRSELDAAASLLRAAGIGARVEAPADLPDTSDDIRARLRTTAAGVLRSGEPRDCVIAVTVLDGRIELDVRADARGVA